MPSQLKLKKILLLFIVVLLYESCSKDIQSLQFYNVAFNGPVVTGVPGNVILEGSIDINGLENLIETGFLWSEDINEIEVLSNENKILSTAPDADGIFTAFRENLGLTNLYHIRAYAIFNDKNNKSQRIVYSQNKTAFSFSIILGIDEQSSILNDQAIISGFATGLQSSDFQSSGFQVQSHGFIFSSTDSVPELGQPGVDELKKGILNVNDIFFDTLTNLEFNTTYYYRSFLSTPNQDYYSDEIGLLHIKGGWKRANDLDFGLLDGYGASIIDRAFILGCPPSIPCHSSQSQEIIEFNNESLAVTGLGTQSELNFFPRINPISFIIQDTFYVGLGDSNGELVDFNKIAIADIGNIQSFTFMENQPLMAPRAGAVVFILDDKAYIGGGLDIIVEQDNYRDYKYDFWQYDPANGSWIMVDSLPFRESPVNPQNIYKGRREAIAFAIEGKGYAGLGENNDFRLNDFWEFTPPSDDHPKGKWNFHSYFEGAGRVDAIFYTLRDRGYFGTGRSSSIGYKKDFWSFHPNEGFKSLEDLPGSARHKATSFTLNNQGYVGLGEVTILNTDGFSIQSALNDLWIYTPEQ